MQQANNVQFKLTESKYFAPPQNSTLYQITSPLTGSRINSSEKPQSSSEKLIDQSSSFHLQQVPMDQVYTPIYDTTDPIQIQCPNCHTFSSSLVSTECTNLTYGAAVVFSLMCVCWVPFAFKKYFQKIRHNCPGCDRIVGEYDYLAMKFNKE